MTQNTKMMKRVYVGKGVKLKMSRSAFAKEVPAGSIGLIESIDEIQHRLNVLWNSGTRTKLSISADVFEVFKRTEKNYI